LVAGSLGSAGFRIGDRVLFSVRPGLDGICLAPGIIAAGGAVVFGPIPGGEVFRARAALAPRYRRNRCSTWRHRGLLKLLACRRGPELLPYYAVVPDARHIYAGPWLPARAARCALPLRTPLAADGE
jgi:hypothetical protein